MSLCFNRTTYRNVFLFPKVSKDSTVRPNGVHSLPLKHESLWKPDPRNWLRQPRYGKMGTVSGIVWFPSNDVRERWETDFRNKPRSSQRHHPSCFTGYLSHGVLRQKLVITRPVFRGNPSHGQRTSSLMEYYMVHTEGGKEQNEGIGEYSKVLYCRFLL